MYARWGNKRCNCKHADACQMHCAAVLWAFDDVAIKSTFRRVRRDAKLLHQDVCDPRLSFVHFLVWDERSRRPVEAKSCQSTETTKDLVAKCLAMRFTQVPTILRPYCTHRGGMTASKLEQELYHMGKQLHLKQLEVYYYILYTFLDNIMHIYCINDITYCAFIHFIS